MDSTWVRWVYGGVFLSSLSIIEKETIIGIESDINIEDGLQAKEGTHAKLDSQGKGFSSNLTSLAMSILLEWGWRSL